MDTSSELARTQSRTLRLMRRFLKVQFSSVTKDFFLFHLILQMFVKSQRLYFNIFLCIKSLGNAMLLLCFWSHLCAHNPVLSHFSRVQLFATLWTVAHQAPLPMGFSRQEYWRGLPCPPPGDLPDPGIELASL